MTDDQLDDLKQFIDTRIPQSEQQVKADIQRLEQKVDGGLAGVGEAIEKLHARLDQVNTETEPRFTKLEHQIAA